MFLGIQTVQFFLGGSQKNSPRDLLVESMTSIIGKRSEESEVSRDKGPNLAIRPRFSLEILNASKKSAFCNHGWLHNP